MKAKVVRDKKGNVYLLLPPEVASSIPSEVELFPLKEGFFLLSPPLPGREVRAKAEVKEESKEAREAQQREERAKRRFTKDEVNLLYKVSLIPYSRRDINSVMSMLDEEERSLLHQLLKKGAIFLRKRKGRDFIAFEENLYEKLKGLKGKREEKEDVEVVDLSQGFLVIKQPKTFYKLRSYLEENRGRLRYLVDPTSGYVYVATKSFLERGAKALMRELSKGPRSAYELAEKLRMPVEAVETIAKFLNEEGLLYEEDPKKKRYALVE